MFYITLKFLRWYSSRAIFETIRSHAKHQTPNRPDLLLPTAKTHHQLRFTVKFLLHYTKDTSSSMSSEDVTAMDVDGDEPQSQTNSRKRAVPHADSDALQLPWVEKYRPKR
jgi:hypothetical protein